LSAAGVPYEIVRGVSSAIAVPAYAGIPVTHRSRTSSLTIVTGDKAHNGCGEVKWRDLARSADTIVILMGQQNLREIMRQLLNGGCEPGRLVALIQSRTRSPQSTLAGTVATIDDLAEGAGFKSPTVIVVGEVVNFRRRLHWHESIIREGTSIAGCEALEATPWMHCV
jgi:uroporphyrinogen III methyltransferase / synthase